MKKRQGIVCATVFVVTMQSLYGVAEGDGTEQYIQGIHRRVADDLIAIRKQYPDLQTQIYSILDQIDKMSSTAKGIVQQQSQLKHLLLNKTAENITLKHELTSVKNEISTTQKTIETARLDLNKKLEDEKAQVQKLSQERKELVNKLHAMDTQPKDQVKKKIAKELAKADLAAVAQKLVAAGQDHNLSRTSTSEPNSPR